MFETNHAPDGVHGPADTEDDPGVCYDLEVALEIQVEVLKSAWGAGSCLLWLVILAGTLRIITGPSDFSLYAFHMMNICAVRTVHAGLFHRMRHR